MKHRGSAKVLLLRRSYLLAAAAGFTGDFVGVSLPNKWKTFVQANRVIMAYANGTVMLIR